MEHALAPLVYTGPAEGQPPEAWRLQPAARILDLKICDFACGSAAFLVAAARYLSARLPNVSVSASTQLVPQAVSVGLEQLRAVPVQRASTRSQMLMAIESGKAFAADNRAPLLELFNYIPDDYPVHSVIAVLFIALIIAHIYIGTLGMEGAFEAMGTGTVDLNWAKEHHGLWLEEEVAKGRMPNLPPSTSPAE